MNLKLACFGILALFVASSFAEPVNRDEKKVEAIRKKSREIMELIGKAGWQTEILDYFTDATVFEVPPGRRYKGLTGFREFMSHLNLEDGSNVVVTTPINVSGTAAAFTKDYRGMFKTGCPIKAEQVVQILQFDSDGQKVTKWTEYFHDDSVFVGQRDCNKDEL